MRPDDINPRTGLIVALCSVSLVFGFMFTVSGIKGETLGDIPLIAIGPAICLPGLAAILLAKKTDGCTKCPFTKCCARKRALDKENSELLKPSWDLESGKGSRDGLDGPDDSMHVRSGEDSVSSTTTVGESRSLIRRVDENEVLRYLEACYPSNVFSGVSSYCALDRMCIPRDSIAYTATRNSVVYIPRDSIVVFSRRESSPYGTYCCYINPGDFTWGHETVV
ncbi:transmembrane protein 215-like [Polypterus senegalus]|uniref:transmembrane protein 215-like n=1 Tax=Polypterus senegalus TaxID=55291 RepID=UPI001963520D|nr:transmembrane protein 215-like [Polypterus senegalus]